MELEQQVKLTDNIHDTLSDLIGKRIEVRANLGRSKIAIYKGQITGTYPAIFTMEAERKRGKTSRQSFQYVDVLTGVVETFHDDGSSIFEKFVIDEEQNEESASEVMLGGTAEDAKDVFEAALQSTDEEMLGSAMPSLTEVVEEVEETLA